MRPVTLWRRSAARRRRAKIFRCFFSCRSPPPPSPPRARPPASRRATAERGESSRHGRQRAEAHRRAVRPDSRLLLQHARRRFDALEHGREYLRLHGRVGPWWHEDGPCGWWMSAHTVRAPVGDERVIENRSNRAQSKLSRRHGRMGKDRAQTNGEFWQEKSASARVGWRSSRTHQRR